MNGQLIGLDYNGVEQISRHLGVALNEDVFTAIQMMESAIVLEMQRRGNDKHKT